MKDPENMVSVNGVGKAGLFFLRYPAGTEMGIENVG